MLDNESDESRFFKQNTYHITHCSACIQISYLPSKKTKSNLEPNFAKTDENLSPANQKRSKQTNHTNKGMLSFIQEKLLTRTAEINFHESGHKAA